VFKRAGKAKGREIGERVPVWFREGIRTWGITDVLRCREGCVCQLYTMRETQLAHVVGMGPDVTDRAIRELFAPIEIHLEQRGAFDNKGWDGIVRQIYKVA
jgi:hypothetical protein